MKMYYSKNQLIHKPSFAYKSSLAQGHARNTSLVCSLNITVRYKCYLPHCKIVICFYLIRCKHVHNKPFTGHNEQHEWVNILDAWVYIDICIHACEGNTKYI